jgi:hypothetical protein
VIPVAEEPGDGKLSGRLFTAQMALPKRAMILEFGKIRYGK